MTEHTITCEAFTDRLMDYLEHDSDDATRAAMERHAVSCAECGPLLADLRKLRVDAANLPALTPSRDLWAGIASRIEAPVVPIGTAHRESGRRSIVARRWMQRALIAASLVAAASLGYVARGTTPASVASNDPAMPGLDTLPGVVVAEAPESASVPAASPTREAAAPRSAGTLATPASNQSATTQTTVVRAVQTLTADYDREIARLRVLINERRNQADPATVAIIERNLQVIDAAIADCKKAIARDPSSRFLIESLNQSLQNKVELMRSAAQLPARS